MEKVTFTLVFILWATLGMLAQNSGGYYSSSQNNSNNTYQNQNKGNGPGKGFRPYGNVGHRPSSNGAHHHYNNHNNNNNNCNSSCNHNTGHHHHHGNNSCNHNTGHHDHHGNNNCNHNTGHHNNQHSCSGGQNCSFGCAHNNYVHVPVHVNAFSGWLHSLGYQRNSAARMSMALDYVENNWLTTHQIYDILSLFSNESTKFMIAENAYPNTCDPQNYHYLYRCFSNSACIMSLRDLGS